MTTYFKFGHKYNRNFFRILPNVDLVGMNHRIFHIPVGNIPHNDIDVYIRVIAERFRRENEPLNVPLIDASGSMGIHNAERDYFIPTRGEVPDITVIDHVSLLTP